MFHIGHLNILKKAKERDYLIVGVSSDELVLRYKNKRPIIPFHDRKKIVSAIRYVVKLEELTIVIRLKRSIRLVTMFYLLEMIGKGRILMNWSITSNYMDQK